MRNSLKSRGIELRQYELSGIIEDIKATMPKHIRVHEFPKLRGGKFDVADVDDIDQWAARIAARLKK